MTTSIVPNTYVARRHCIEVHCRLRLDADYIRQRIASLESPGDVRTQQFVSRWGEPHGRRVVAWFRRAGGELDSNHPTGG